jgi:hypothetical protein
MDPLLYGLSCLIVLGIVVAGAMPSVRASRPAQLWLALAYVGVIVLLRQAAESPTGGFAPLVILPALWLALYGSWRQLLIDLAVTFAALALPWALVGGDQYPASTPRSALLVLAVAAIAGLSIQRLLGQARASRDRLSGVLAAATGNAIVATRSACSAIAPRRSSGSPRRWCSSPMTSSRRSRPSRWRSPPAEARRRAS